MGLPNVSNLQYSDMQFPAGQATEQMFQLFTPETSLQSARHYIYLDTQEKINRELDHLRDLLKKACVKYAKSKEVEEVIGEQLALEILILEGQMDDLLEKINNLRVYAMRMKVLGRDLLHALQLHISMVLLPTKPED